MHEAIAASIPGPSCQLPPRGEPREYTIASAYGPPEMSTGLYGTYGGRYVPETLIPALDELEAGWRALGDDFHQELAALQRTYIGRPTPLYETVRFAPEGKRILLKREDLCHTGAHKINNAVGQALLAQRLGKHRIVAETARASTASRRPRSRRFGLECASTWAPRTCAGMLPTSSG